MNLKAEFKKVNKLNLLRALIATILISQVYKETGIWTTIFCVAVFLQSEIVFAYLKHIFDSITLIVRKLK